MAEKEIVLINKSAGRFTINFLGQFPNNKWAFPKGKIYLTEKEWDFVKVSCSHVIGKQLVLENEEKKESKPVVSGKGEQEVEEDDFFNQHHSKWKKQISKMDIQEVEEKLALARENEEVSDKIVAALEERLEELGE